MYSLAAPLAKEIHVYLIQEKPLVPLKPEAKDNKHLFFCKNCSFRTSWATNLEKHQQTDCINSIRNDKDQTKFDKYKRMVKNGTSRCDTNDDGIDEDEQWISKLQSRRTVQRTCRKQATNNNYVSDEIIILSNDENDDFEALHLNIDNNSNYKRQLEIENGEDNKKFCSNNDLDTSQNAKKNVTLKKRFQKKDNNAAAENADSTPISTDLSKPKKKYVYKRKRVRVLCTVCGKSFAKECLKKHLKIHLGEKDYECDLCGRKFISKENVRSHRRVHTGDKQHICAICGRRFNTPSSLDAHNRIHTGERPFSCDVCKATFRTKYHMSYHMQRFHCEVSFTCDICGKAFAVKERLNVHLYIHKGQPFCCSLCDRRFKKRRFLQSHLRDIHSMMVDITAIQANIPVKTECLRPIEIVDYYSNEQNIVAFYKI